VLAEAATAWDVPTQLQPVLAAWVHAQISGFDVWVQRQLQQESWQPLGQGQVRICCICVSLCSVLCLFIAFPGAGVGQQLGLAASH
jgi:hypothetical protein